MMRTGSRSESGPLGLSQRKKNPLGPTGATVAHDVKRLRTRLDWGFNDLAGRLAELGRPIPPLGLRKNESLQRRVDADDLVALAVALATNPNALLLPPTASPKHVVTVTTVGERPHQRSARGRPVNGP